MDLGSFPHGGCIVFISILVSLHYTSHKNRPCTSDTALFWCPCTTRHTMHLRYCSLSFFKDHAPFHTPLIPQHLLAFIYRLIHPSSSWHIHITCQTGSNQFRPSAQLALASLSGSNDAKQYSSSGELSWPQGTPPGIAVYKSPMSCNVSSD